MWKFDNLNLCKFQEKATKYSRRDASVWVALTRRSPLDFTFFSICCRFRSGITLYNILFFNVIFDMILSKVNSGFSSKKLPKPFIIFNLTPRSLLWMNEKKIGKNRTKGTIFSLIFKKASVFWLHHISGNCMKTLQYISGWKNYC